MGEKMTAGEAKAYVDELYRKVAKRWEERVTNSQFMKELMTGRLSKQVFRLFFKNWAAYTIEINTLEAASYHKHIHFFASIGSSWRPWLRNWRMSLYIPNHRVIFTW